MKKIGCIALLSIILSACIQIEDEDSTYIEEHEGILVQMEQKDGEDDDPYKGWYYLLVISDVENVNLSGKTEDELIKLAQDNDGAYYNVNPDMFEELDVDIGARLVLYYSGEGESDPPVRDAKEIDVVAK